MEKVVWHFVDEERCVRAIHLRLFNKLFAKLLEQRVLKLAHYSRISWLTLLWLIPPT